MRCPMREIVRQLEKTSDWYLIEKLIKIDE